MTSNPSQPAPEWPAAGPAPSEPLEALPAPEGGLPAHGDRWQTGPAGRVRTGPQSHWQDGPLPTAQAPWPVPAGAAQQATGPRAPVAAPDPPDQAALPDSAGSRDPAGSPDPASPPASPGERRLATLSYLGVPFLGPLVPLAIYLIKRRASGFVRRHSAQAVNLSITALVYSFCILILGAMLALGSILLALVIGVALAVVLWLAALAYVIAACASTNRGGSCRIPAWLCATIVR